MSVNFYKHHDELVSAYRECLDPKCNTNWAMFGYDKQTNDLILLEKGTGGLSELADEFNPSKIQYAFCQAKDEQTGVSRFLLINWQGESAPMQRKGVCMNHFRDVQQFFKGAHVVIQAQTEDEVESDVLMSHVMKMSNRIKIDKIDSSEKEGITVECSKPVGTNYQRVNAQTEISQTDRENFWEKQKKEDETQRKAERQKEAEARASRTKESTSACRSLEKPVVPNKSFELRQARMDEAKQLISERFILNAKAFFENAQNNLQNGAQGRKAPIKIDRGEPVQISEKVTKSHQNENISNEIIKNVSNNKVSMSCPDAQNVITEKTDSIKSDFIPKSDITSGLLTSVPSSSSSSSPSSSSPSLSSIPIIVEPVNGNANSCSLQNGLTKVPEEEEEEVDDAAEKDYEDSEIVINNDDGSSSEEMYTPTIDYMGDYGRNSYYEPRPLENIEEENEEDNGDCGLCARALYDYQAAEDGEITFDPDDVITHIDQIDAGWWQGLAPNGVYGLFPANYVELLPPSN